MTLAPAWVESVPDEGAEPSAFPEERTPEGETPVAGPMAPAPHSRPVLRLIELGPPDVEPLGGVAAPGIEPHPVREDRPASPPARTGGPPEGAVVPAFEPAGGPAVPAEVAALEARGEIPAPPVPDAASGAAVGPAVAPPAARRALVAEDSIVAAIFLSRLLEREGFDVVTVAGAAALRREMTRPWSVVFADVELPDAPAGRALIGLEPRAADGRPAPVIALVRDADDTALAGAFGVLRTLRKPFEAERLAGLLVELGLGRG
jgi:CheY-like chemotaxis protein